MSTSQASPTGFFLLKHASQLYTGIPPEDVIGAEPISGGGFRWRKPIGKPLPQRAFLSLNEKLSEKNFQRAHLIPYNDNFLDLQAASNLPSPPRFPYDIKGGPEMNEPGTDMQIGSLAIVK